MTNHEYVHLPQDLPESAHFVDDAERGPLYTEVVGDIRRADEAYRQEFADYLVENTVGTVGVYATMDLKEHGQQLYDTLTQRNPGKRFDPSIASSVGGGWGNYGERNLHLDDDPLKSCYKDLEDNHEELHTMVMSDGSVEIRYAFTARGYVDGTDRPGNTLTVGFTTTPEAAVALVAGATSDPRFINKIVEAQVKAVGISDAYWGRRLRPNYGFGEGAPQENERVLSIFQHSPDASVADARKVVYGEPRVVKSASRPESASQSIPESTVDEAALTEEHKQIAWEVIASQQEEGLSSVNIMVELAEAMYEFDSHDMLPQVEKVAGSDAYGQVFEEFFIGQIEELDVEAKAGLVSEYLKQVLGSYVDKAMEQGRDMHELGDFLYDDDPSTELAAMQLSALTDALASTPYADVVNDKSISQFLSVIIQNKNR